MKKRKKKLAHTLGCLIRRTNARFWCVCGAERLMAPKKAPTS